MRKFMIVYACEDVPKYRRTNPSPVEFRRAFRVASGTDNIRPKLNLPHPPTVVKMYTTAISLLV